MAAAALDVDFINVEMRRAWLTDGRDVPITNFFDEHGDEIADPLDAVAFVCGEGGQWFTCRFANFGVETTN